MFNINNFVIDRFRRGIMTSSSDGSIMYSINQIENPSLKCGADEKSAVDASGATIATFENAKSATFSGENSLFDLGLYAAQMGTSKEIASADKKIITPIFETIDVVSTTVVLKHKPVKEISEIYVLNGDSTLGKKYLKSAGAVSDTTFSYDESTLTITLPTEVKIGEQIFIMYEYEAENAVSITNSALEFPKMGKLVMEVLGVDVCDTTTQVIAYLIFPNAKLTSNVDANFSTDGKHPFEIKAQQAYCDKKKKLFQIIIPEDN